MKYKCANAKVVRIHEISNGCLAITFLFEDANGEICVGNLVSYRCFDKEQTEEWKQITLRFLKKASSEEIAERVDLGTKANALIELMLS